MQGRRSSRLKSSKIDDLGVRSWKRQRISSVEASKPDSGNANERPVVVSPLYRKLKREKKERKREKGKGRRMATNGSGFDGHHLSSFSAHRVNLSIRIEAPF